ncbi:C-terminal binding protein [Pseudonocardia sp. GCM10023141]|uniref:C-terminal binding protein n=1 Tax=Pseudonocardia sp. GCM10023141 TaxID=3252653 RepID=UPI00360D464E
MRITVVDCDHDSFVPERGLAAELGVELSVRPSADADELVRNAHGADAILMQYAPITADVLDRLPGVRAVGRYGVGYDTVDVDAATARGVAVCNVTDYGTEAVAEHAVALALALVRGLPQLDRGLRRGSHALVRPVHELASLTFGVVGLGAIGRAAARKAAALGFRVLGHDVAPAAGAGIERVPLAELADRSDVVSLHVPLTPATRGLVGAGLLGDMRPGAVLVNTSRGGVVDTAALVAALEAGRLGGAGLDVLDDEPVSADHPLTRFDRVVLTPHTAWYSEESFVRLKRRALQNVVDVLRGATPHDLLNPGAVTA